MLTLTNVLLYCVCVHANDYVNRPVMHCHGWSLYKIPILLVFKQDLLQSTKQSFSTICVRSHANDLYYYTETEQSEIRNLINNHFNLSVGCRHSEQTIPFNHSRITPVHECVLAHNSKLWNIIAVHMYAAAFATQTQSKALIFRLTDLLAFN